MVEGVHDLSDSSLDIVTEIHHDVIAGLSTSTTKHLYLVLHRSNRPLLQGQKLKKPIELVFDVRIQHIYVRVDVLELNVERS